MEEKLDIQAGRQKKEGQRDEKKLVQVLDKGHGREVAEGRNPRPAVLVRPPTDRLQISLRDFFETCSGQGSLAGQSGDWLNRAWEIFRFSNILYICVLSTLQLFSQVQIALFWGPHAAFSLTHLKFPCFA